MPETEVAPQQSTTQDDTAVPMDAGVSTETYNASKKEADDLRQQLATLKARMDVSDNQKREQIVSMKAANIEFFEKEIFNNSMNEPYKQQLQPVMDYLKKIDEGDSVDTNLSIGRSFERIGATMKREREEFAKTKDASNLLAEANKQLEVVTGERDASRQRATELEGLVEERTKAAQAFQDELAKTGAIKEKIDFSNKSARENTGGASGEAAGITKQVEEASLYTTPIDANAALFAFMSGAPSNGGLKIMQSGSTHHYLGATGSSTSDGVAQAIRGY
jgi:hypothetical protein